MGLTKTSNNSLEISDESHYNNIQYFIPKTQAYANFKQRLQYALVLMTGGNRGRACRLAGVQMLKFIPDAGVQFATGRNEATILNDTRTYRKRRSVLTSVYRVHNYSDSTFSVWKKL